MTAQTPEKFRNKHPRVNTAGLRLYFMTAELPVKLEPPELEPPAFAVKATGLWRGYVGTWRLTADGKLALRKLEFPYMREGRFEVEYAVQPVGNVIVDGDFELVFRTSFYGSETRVPFVDGRVVEDRSRWKFETRLTAAEAFAAVNVGDINEAAIVKKIDGGFLVCSDDNFGIFFLPNKNATAAMLANPEAFIHQVRRWRVTRKDVERRCIEVAPE